ncbi:MAG: glycosyltransferase, partial [Pseudomonadota bacterium]
AGIMVASPSLRRELERRGFQHLLPWTRGVDTALFHPSRRDAARLALYSNETHRAVPKFLFVGRVAVEKNIETFLTAPLKGEKIVVGDGPALTELQARFPQARFVGKLTGNALAEQYAAADVFVFPSLTDTFGIVMLEAMASGVPVAAFDVTGPCDVVTPGVSGELAHDQSALGLAQAAHKALQLDRTMVRTAAMQFSWQSCAVMFLSNVLKAHKAAGWPVDTALFPADARDLANTERSV